MASKIPHCKFLVVALKFGDLVPSLVIKYQWISVVLLFLRFAFCVIEQGNWIYKEVVSPQPYPVTETE